MAKIANCIFCDQKFGPGRRRSDEHAAPQWCGELLPKRGQAQHEYIRMTPEGLTRTDHGLRDPFTTVCRGVCEPCNTGWMGELEKAVQPFLGPMIQGQAYSLSFWRQVTAAIWATKTVMVWDSVVPQYKQIPPLLLHRLRATQHLNVRQQVWIGRYNNPENSHHLYRQANAYHVGKIQDVAGAHMSFLVIGELAFFVFGHVESEPLSCPMPPGLDRKMLRVWPPKHEQITWPPPEPLTDEDSMKLFRALDLLRPWSPDDYDPEKRALSSSGG